MTSEFGMLFRCDESPQIGLGHVMRCKALAHACQDVGANIYFAMAEASAEMERMLEDQGMQVVWVASPPGRAADAEDTIALARKTQSTWVVVDGYQFDGQYQQAIQLAGLKQLFFDDYGHAKCYCANFVLNQNIDAKETLYINRIHETQLLLGTTYALLRPEFWRWRTWDRIIAEKARKILITMGGADPKNVTHKVIQALSPIFCHDMELVVVIGQSNVHGDLLQETISNLDANIKLVCNAQNMSELMAWADVAVSAGGSTCWELAFMGLPALVLVLGANQQGLSQGLHEAGVVRNLGCVEDVQSDTILEHFNALRYLPEERLDMSRLGRKLIDGLGAQRVAQLLKETSISTA